MEPPDEELPPGYAAVLAALHQPVEVDDEVRTRHLATALAAATPTKAAHRSRLIGALATAAAIITLVGVAGTWFLDHPTEDSSATESVAAGTPSTVAGQRDTQRGASEAGAADEAGALPSSSSVEMGAATRAPSATAPPLKDLGSFTDVTTLRAAASGVGLASGDDLDDAGNAIEKALPTTSVVPAPAEAICRPPLNTSWRATATLAGAPVLVGLDPTGNVVLVDATTCALR